MSDAYRVLHDKLIRLEIEALRKSIDLGAPVMKAEALGEANGYRAARLLLLPAKRKR